MVAGMPSWLLLSITEGFSRLPALGWRQANVSVHLTMRLDKQRAKERMAAAAAIGFHLAVSCLI